MTWWRRLRSRGRMEEQLEKELRFHLDQQTSDLIAQGLDPQTALRQARIDLGGPEQVKEQCRDARGTRWAEDLWQDIRYALRSLKQRPGFAAVALLTLALGIGATTVMFTVIHGVLLKPLPFPDPEELVTINGHTDTWNTAQYGQQNLAYLDFLDCRQESRTLNLEGWMYTDGTLSEPGEAEYVSQFEASANLFSILRVPMLHGRAFSPEEDKPGGTAVAILGYTLWQRRFAGNAAVVSSAVVLNGKRYTIVGVAPAAFRLDGDEGDIYTPLGQNTAEYMKKRGPHPVRVIARMRNGATLAQARAELSMLGRQLGKQFPDTNKDRSFVAQPLRPSVGDVARTLWLLLGVVGLVLLIACANVASLLLARAVSRERELAMRAALGAGRSRLIRQCLTESALLGLAGGFLGVVIAAVGARPFVAFWPGGLPRAEEVQLDWRVLVFALASSVICGLLFGLAPALRAPAREMEQILRAGARTVVGGSRRLHSSFVIAEVALAVVLLVSAGMLSRTVLHLSSLDPGLNSRNVLTARVALSPATLDNTGQIRAAWQEVLANARRVPGVQSVAIVDTVPMREGNNQLGYSTSTAIPPENRQPIALATSVTPDYLKVTEIPLREGRFFDDHDRLGSDLVVVIDEVFAKQAFGNAVPIGRHLWFPDMGSNPVTVVGVVGHVRHWGLAGDDQAQVRAQFYYPFTQVPDPLLRRWSELMSIAVRTSVKPLSVVEALRGELHGAGNDQVLYQVQTMEQLVGSSLARQRFLLLLFGIFAGLALLLACLGIYGVMAYLTSQRVPEMGMRMALGAGKRDILWLVLRRGLGLISAGMGIGTLAAAGAGRILVNNVEGMQTVEPSAFAVMIPVLFAAALFASFLPANRASKIDPMTALRED